MPIVDGLAAVYIVAEAAEVPGRVVRFAARSGVVASVPVTVPTA